MKLRTLTLACLALLIFGSSAFAAPVTAQMYYNYIEGDHVSDLRDDPAKALGLPDDSGTSADTDFVSLGVGTYNPAEEAGAGYTGNGYGGSVYFSFGAGTTFSGWATIYEATYTRSNYEEYASVLGSVDGVTWEWLGDIDNQNVDVDGGATVYFTGTYAYLMVVDATALNDGVTWGDGYDIDAVVVNATPIPGAAWLLGSGLVGLVGLRRRFSL